jgi:pseudoazurin
MPSLIRLKERCRFHNSSNTACCLIRIKEAPGQKEEMTGNRTWHLSTQQRRLTMRTFTALVTAAAILLPTLPAMAANFEVQMLNKGEAGAMVFEPALTNVAVGDTVTFLPTDKGHNAETMKEILPEGAEAFKGAMGKEIVVTFTVPGVYGVKCAPHYAMGMVALVAVGDAPIDAEAIKAVKAPKKVHERLEQALGE